MQKALSSAAKLDNTLTLKAGGSGAHRQDPIALPTSKRLASDQMTTPKIQSIIQNFVSELSAALVEASHAAIAEALGGGGTTRTVSAGAGKLANAPKAAKRAKGAKRTPEELTALTQSLLTFVKRHPGQRIEQIAAAISASTKDLALPAKKLIGEKKLSTKGQKRATTYFPK